MENTVESKSNFWTVVFFAIIGIGSIMVICQFFGMKSFERDEKTIVLDRNAVSQSNRKLVHHRQADSDNREKSAETTLKSIADEFKGPVYANIRTANLNNNWGLSDDEAKFYDGLRSSKTADPNVSENWLGKVKKAHQTYSTIKEMFGGKADVQSMMDDAQTAMQTMSQINRLYGISMQELKAFAPNAKSVGDWANYIENNKK
jgi:cytoskeletal protein RodZ